ncbi:hypothetical protein [Streptomyces sp. TRM75563]|uniref:hypothetical protein n=1 Tax=Streptomyces sp. TRM75563 TaxID=2817418 RepID=UPI001F60292E|nr:hypothetical protein [Streptomyces sp. TRM75563]MCI4040772.1 hypothetical protein [Streptomyces sp. TRM75563]
MVSQSQPVIAQPNRSVGSVRASTVVTTEPTSTANITGDLIITRGSSLRTASGRDLAKVIWRVPIFLPRYSGVRPTISPAMNTAMTAMISMP